MRLAWLDLSPAASTPLWQLEDEAPQVAAPGFSVVASVASYDDEIFAYLFYDYLRSRTAVQPAEVLLIRRQDAGPAPYAVALHPGPNLLTAIPFLEGNRRQGYIQSYDWRLLPNRELARFRRQTEVFQFAYNLPAQRRLEGLTREQKRELVRRFTIFKSQTDPRIRKRMEPAPALLTNQEAERLVDDVLAVADFFWLPLDFFLGIGAMENNYMNVPGDLDHAIWKRRAERGDIVLRRRSDGRVLVVNYATGVWQITRETLRYAHRLYRQGEWDYSLLPAHLQPPEQLDFDNIDPSHLTTYAGLLFRDLLNRFEGDIARAVGAYNGGPGNPNMRYEQGVRIVANYARRMLEQAARLEGQAAADMSFLAPPRE